jgi:hypothetical protein
MRIELLQIVLFGWVFTGMTCESRVEYALDDPRLSAYSERGEGLASAIVGDEVWWYQEDCHNYWSGNEDCYGHKTEILQFRNALVLVMHGGWKNERGNHLSLYFVLKEEQANGIDALADLGTFSSIVPEDMKVYAGFSTLTDNAPPRRSTLGVALYGQFHVRRNSGSIFYESDDTIGRVILSGTFGFDFIINRQSYAFRHGRFDLWISYYSVIDYTDYDF